MKTSLNQIQAGLFFEVIEKNYDLLFDPTVNDAFGKYELALAARYYSSLKKRSNGKQNESQELPELQP